MNSKNTTIIICCAGMGTRLGIGTTKALVSINGKPLILKMLEQLNDYEDIRVVVGYQAEKLINVINEYRKDIMYAFNYNYETTGPAESMWKGLINSKENIIVFDGDLVFEPNSLKEFLNYDKECIAYSKNSSDEPIYLNADGNKAINFCIENTNYIWPGIIKIKKEKIKLGSNYIYETIKHNFPMKLFKVNVMEIDTQDDYEKALKWINNNYKEGETNE